MNNLLLIVFGFVIFVSCGSSTTKKNVQNIVIRKYISVVDNTHDYSSAYTEEGHVMIYGKDSTNNHIVYFAKFDNNAVKYENGIIKDKIVRAELDSSLSSIKSFVTISGGAFCDTNEQWGYDAYYFDENLNYNSMEQIEVPLNKEQLNDLDHEHMIKRILDLLDIGYNIALSINNTNASGWYNIVSALEPIQDLKTYDIMENDTIYDPLVKKHISKINKTTEGLTQFHNLLQEKHNSQNRTATR